MTQDEIIEMARQAGFGLRYEGRGQISSAPTTTEKLEAFAKLVEERTAAKEREACAKVCEAQEDKGGEWDVQQQCANAIRARGQ
jgi:hypothetical protein